MCILESVNPVAEKSSFSCLCSRQYKKMLLIENHFDTRSTQNLRGYLHFTVWKLSYYYASYNQFSYPWCIPNYQHHSARDSRRLSVSVEWCERTYLSNNYNGNHSERKLIFHIRYFLYKSHIFSCYIKKDNLITYIMIWILLKYFDVSMLPEIQKETGIAYCIEKSYQKREFSHFKQI